MKPPIDYPQHVCCHCYQRYHIKFQALGEYSLTPIEKREIAEKLNRCSSCAKPYDNIAVKCKNLRLHLGYTSDEEMTYVEERWADIFPELNGNGWKAFLQIRRKYKPGPNFLKPQEPDWAERAIWLERFTTVILGYKWTTLFTGLAVLAGVAFLKCDPDSESYLSALNALSIGIILTTLAFLMAKQETSEIQAELENIDKRAQKNLPENTLPQLPDDDEPETMYSEDDIVPDNKLD